MMSWLLWSASGFAVAGIVVVDAVEPEEVPEIAVVVVVVVVFEEIVEEA